MVVRCAFKKAARFKVFAKSPKYKVNGHYITFMIRTKEVKELILNIGSGPSPRHLIFPLRIFFLKLNALSLPPTAPPRAR